MNIESLTAKEANQPKINYNQAMELLMKSADSGNALASLLVQTAKNSTPPKVDSLWNSELFDIVSTRTCSKDAFTQGESIFCQILHPLISGSFVVFMTSDKYMLMSVFPTRETSSSELESFALEFIEQAYGEQNA